MEYEKFNDDELGLRDHLAIDRTSMASERTFLAYARTAIMLAATGVTLLKLFEDSRVAQLGAVATFAAAALVAAVGLNRYLVLSKQLRRLMR